MADMLPRKRASTQMSPPREVGKKRRPDRVPSHPATSLVESTTERQTPAERQSQPPEEAPRSIYDGSVAMDYELDTSDRRTMEPNQNNCFDGFDKSYFPDNRQKEIVTVKPSGDMPPKYKKLRSGLQEYGNSASFHGLRFVTDPQANKPRRIFWIVLLMACLAVLIYQIVDRVSYFYSYPVTVNVKVNYNTTLDFPAVTICNQNAFKATLSASMGRYRLIEKMYTDPETFNQTDLRQFSAENISLSDLYLQSAHRKEDFVFRRIWKGKPVHEQDIQLSVTDHGVCYTLKNWGNDGFVTSPGVEHGLRLAMNIEQYEYMPGPHDAAGIKMLLHDPNEIPRVHALGQAIPPGSHVFVGVKMIEVTNLPRPHGDCFDKTLEYADMYTTEACQLDCLTRRAAEKCGCRSFFMPEKNGFPPICNLETYYGCLQNVLETFPMTSATVCDCPVPCNFKLYETDISYASTSEYSLNKFLSDYDKGNLSKSLLEAAEVTSRYEVAKFLQVQSLYDKLICHMDEVRKKVIVNVKESVNKATLDVYQRYKEIKDHYNWKDYLYRYQQYILQKNFMRPRDAYEERIFHIVALAYAEYIMTVEGRIRMLAGGDFTDDSTRRLLYEDVSALLAHRKRIVEIAYVNYTSLIEAYNTGIQIFNYKFFETPLAHNIPAAPKLLIKESRVHNSYAREYGKRFESYFNRTIAILEFCHQLLDEAYLNMTLDEGNMTECRETFRYLMRNWVFAKSVFYFDTIDWPLKQLEERHQNFDKQWIELQTVFGNLNQSLISLKTEIESFETGTFESITEIRDSVKGYLNNTVTKLHISERFTSLAFQHLVTNFDLFFQQLRSRESSMMDWLSQMNDDAFGILKVIVNDRDSWEYYNFTGRTEYLENISAIERDLRENYTATAALMQFSNSVNGGDSVLLSTFSDFVEDMTAYKDSLKIDSNFIKDNFLHVDIFYRQMSYEEIHQQKAYGMFSLWFSMRFSFNETVTERQNMAHGGCDQSTGDASSYEAPDPTSGDIGGTMGLFLGASFLSLVELVDFILTHSVNKKPVNKEHTRKQFL